MFIITWDNWFGVSLETLASFLTWGLQCVLHLKSVWTLQLEQGIAACLEGEFPRQKARSTWTAWSSLPARSNPFFKPHLIYKTLNSLGTNGVTGYLYLSHTSDIYSSYSPFANFSSQTKNCYLLSVLGTGCSILEFVLSWQWESPLGHSEILCSPPGFQFLSLSCIPCIWVLINVLGQSEWAKFVFMSRKLFLKIYFIFNALSTAELCGD